MEHTILAVTNFISEHGFWIIGGSIAIVAIVFTALKEIIQTSTRERTRREIAAYIAEGSMTPEQGERLMHANNKADKQSCG